MPLDPREEARRNMPASVLSNIQVNQARDPADKIPGMPPNFGDWLLPHVVTFQGIVSSIARVYRPTDEALKHSLENARYMLNDPTVTECLEQRQRSVSLLNWHLEPADAKDPEQKELCENLTKILKQTPRFMQYRECLGKAIWYGKYANQKRYQWKSVYGAKPCGRWGNVVIGEWKPVNGDKLVFRYDDGRRQFDPNQIGVRVGAAYTAGSSVEGKWEESAHRKVEPTDWGLAYFLDKYERRLITMHKHMIEDGDYDDPQSAGKIHGVGIRSRIYWFWYQKQELTAWLLEFLERSAFGLEIWHYPMGNPEAEEKTRTAAEERIGQGRNIILFPKPMDETGGSPYGVEKLEPGMAGADAIDRILREFYGHGIKRYILGQTLTSEAQATGLGSDLGHIHLSTFKDIVQYDCTNLEETITTEDVEPLKRLNYPDMASVPVYFKIDTESADSDAKLQAYKNAWEMGAKIKSADVYDCIGASKPEPTDEVLPDNPQFQQAQQQAQQGAQQQYAAQQGKVQVRGGLGEEEKQAMADDVWQGVQAAQLEEALADDGTAGADKPLPSENSEREKVGVYSLASELDRARLETDGNPSEEQKRAGNYRKGKITIQGLPVSIENPKGSTRRGKSAAGEWSIVMPHDYGYIKQTKSEADSDHVDVFLGPHLDSEMVFVIDQTKAPGWRNFDEHKVMLGWTSADKAKQAYLDSYSRGWRGFDGITPMTIDQFKAWLKYGNSSRRIGEQITEHYAKHGAAAGQRGLFDESKVNRDDEGQFAEKEGEGGGKPAPAAAPEAKEEGEGKEGASPKLPSYIKPYAGADGLDSVQPSVGMVAWTTDSDTGKLQAVKVNAHKGYFDQLPIWKITWLDGPNAGTEDERYGKSFWQPTKEKAKLSRLDPALIARQLCERYYRVSPQDAQDAFWRGEPGEVVVFQDDRPMRYVRRAGAVSVVDLSREAT